LHFTQCCTAIRFSVAEWGRMSTAP
jgi:hypothetical protein